MMAFLMMALLMTALLLTALGHSLGIVSFRTCTPIKRRQNFSVHKDVGTFRNIEVYFHKTRRDGGIAGRAEERPDLKYRNLRNRSSPLVLTELGARQSASIGKRSPENSRLAYVGHSFRKRGTDATDIDDTDA